MNSNSGTFRPSGIYTNSGIYNISNEHLLLIDILNTMYNDNLRQITNLNESNNQIRNLIIQMLNINNSQRNSRRNNFSDIITPQNENLGRIILNNIPYVIDSIESINIPSNRNTRMSNNEFTRVLQSFLDPVEVYPTQIQIETATRNVRYCDIVSPKNISCPISLNNFNDSDMVTVIRHCGHIFNTSELNTWFRNHCNCPVCRFDIRDDNSNASSLFSAQNNITSNNSHNLPSTANNSSENMSSQSNVERSNSPLINTLLDNIINQYGLQDFITSSYTDASGNTNSIDFLRLLGQINNRNTI